MLAFILLFSCVKKVNSQISQNGTTKLATPSWHKKADLQILSTPLAQIECGKNVKNKS